MTTLDLRGRDLIIIPPEESLHLSTSELLQVLFGSYLPFTIRASIQFLGHLCCSYIFYFSSLLNTD